MAAVVIKLTTYEMMMAANIGVMRQVESIKYNMQPKYGSDSEGDWQKHIESAMTECVMAKYKNVFWCKRDRKDPDVGDFEVRASQRPDARLIIHHDDFDDRAYWLVTGKNGTYTVHGYMMGRDAKNQKYWTDPKTGRPAFFVPQSDLIQPEDNENV